MLAYELNLAAGKLALEAADAASTPDKPRFVAGALGPTNRTASISPDFNDPGKRNVSYEELVEAYVEQGHGLFDGGVDLLLIETIFDTLNAKAAIFACEQLFIETGVRLPVIISGPITDARSEEHTSELQSLMRISYAVFCLKKKITTKYNTTH